MNAEQPRLSSVLITSAPCRRKPLSDGLERAVGGDGAADLLDAEMCATQAAWAALRPRYGLPAGAFGAEGWIVSA
jgi:hypothetical protein